jgi:hypothetical protein
MNYIQGSGGNIALRCRWPWSFYQSLCKVRLSQFHILSWTLIHPLISIRITGVLGMIFLIRTTKRTDERRVLDDVTVGALFGRSYTKIKNNDCASEKQDKKVSLGLHGFIPIHNYYLTYYTIKATFMITFLVLSWFTSQEGTYMSIVWSGARKRTKTPTTFVTAMNG